MSRVLNPGKRMRRIFWRAMACFKVIRRILDSSKDFTALMHFLG